MSNGHKQGQIRVLSIGEIQCGVCLDREMLGGAPFNFAVNTLRLGDESARITVLGDDQRGAVASETIRKLGLNFEGVPGFTINHPAACDCMALSGQVLDWALAFQTDWIYFAMLLNANPAVERFTTELLRRSPGARCVYDVNLRKDDWNIGLVRRLVATCSGAIPAITPDAALSTAMS